MKRGTVAGVVGAGVVLLAVLAWRHADGDGGPGAVAGSGVAAWEPGSAGALAAGPPAGGQARAGSQAAAPEAPPSATSAPLPALDVPLRLVVDELRQRAEAGDAGAACRLAAEFERCRALGSQVNTVGPDAFFLEVLMGHAQESGHADQVQPLVEEQDRAWQAASREFEHCAGVPEPSPAEEARYWRRAALGGHVPAMRHYAVGNAFSPGDLMAVVPELETYRHEAERLAVRAATAGDLAMIHELAYAYLPDGPGGDWVRRDLRPFLDQVVEADARKALEWLYVLQAHPDAGRVPEGHPVRELPARHLAELEARLPPDEVVAASGAAAARTRGWRPGQSAPVRTKMYGGGRLADVTREECEPAEGAWRTLP